MAITDPAMGLAPGSTRQERRAERKLVWEAEFAANPPKSTEDVDRSYDAVLDWAKALAPVERALLEQNITNALINLGEDPEAITNQMIKDFLYASIEANGLTGIPAWIPPRVIPLIEPALAWAIVPVNANKEAYIATWGDWELGAIYRIDTPGVFTPTTRYQGGTLVQGSPVSDLLLAKYLAFVMAGGL